MPKKRGAYEVEMKTKFRIDGESMAAVKEAVEEGNIIVEGPMKVKVRKVKPFRQWKCGCVEYVEGVGIEQCGDHYRSGTTP